MCVCVCSTRHNLNTALGLCDSLTLSRYRAPTAATAALNKMLPGNESSYAKLNDADSVKLRSLARACWRLCAAVQVISPARPT